MGNKTRPVGDKWAINHGLLAQTKMNVPPQGAYVRAFCGPSGGEMADITGSWAINDW